MTKKDLREGSSLNSMFEELGELQEVQEIALRKMLAAELEKAMRRRRWSVVRLAKELGTSRPQVDRLLHPSPSNSITVSTLTRAAAFTGKRVVLIDA